MDVALRLSSFAQAGDPVFTVVESEHPFVLTGCPAFASLSRDMTARVNGQQFILAPMGLAPAIHAFSAADVDARHKVFSPTT
jgi:hypothetical protein